MTAFLYIHLHLSRIGRLLTLLSFLLGKKYGCKAIRGGVWL